MRMPGVGEGDDAFARMDPEQIKEARLSGILAFGKEAELLNSPYEFK